MKKIFVFVFLIFISLSFFAVEYAPLSFNNSEVSITIKPVQLQGIQMYEVEIENLTVFNIEIDWEKSYMTDNLGNSAKIVLNENVISGNYSQQFPSYIPSKGKFEKYIMPETHISGDSLYNTSLEERDIRIFLKYTVDGMEREAFGNLEFLAMKEKGPMDDMWPWIIGGVGVLTVVGIMLLQKGP